MDPFTMARKTMKIQLRRPFCNSGEYLQTVRLFVLLMISSAHCDSQIIVPNQSILYCSERLVDGVTARPRGEADIDIAAAERTPYIPHTIPFNNTMFLLSSKIFHPTSCLRQQRIHSQYETFYHNARQLSPHTNIQCF